METNNKLREALEKIRVIAKTFMDATQMRRVTDSARIDVGNIKDLADAALAAQARNCDVGTAKEQAERWYWRYHVGHLCQSCPLGPRKWSEVDAGTLCFSEWQQMPYEEGGNR